MAQNRFFFSQENKNVNKISVQKKHLNDEINLIVKELHFYLLIPLQNKSCDYNMYTSRIRIKIFFSIGE